MYSLVRTIDATTEPVSVAEVKDQARVLVDVDDLLLSGYISAARQLCEEATGRAFLSQTWRLSLESFPSYGWSTNQLYGQRRSFDGLPYWRTPQILLPRPCLLGIVSVTYLDLTGTRQTLDPSLYTTDFDGNVATLSPVLGSWWPLTLPYHNNVQITYSSGYGYTPASVPAPIRLAIQMLVAHWYENREATLLPESGTGLQSIPFGIAELLRPYVLDLFTLES